MGGGGLQGQFSPQTREKLKRLSHQSQGRIVLNLLYFVLQLALRHALHLDVRLQLRRVVNRLGRQKGELRRQTTDR